MKQYSFLSFISLIFVSTFMSCSKETVYSLPNNETGVEVSFTSNIKASTPIIEAADSRWNANDGIGVYMLSGESASVVGKTGNIPYTTLMGGDIGVFHAIDQAIYLPNKKKQVRFMAYFPYKANVAKNTYKVDVRHQASQSDIDLMYSFDTTAYYNEPTTDNEIPLVFGHKLTKIFIYIRAGKGFSASELENIQVSFTGLNTKADFDLLNGSLRNFSKKAEIVPVKKAACTEYAAGFEAIVLPAENTVGAQIVFDLNNGNKNNGISSDRFFGHFPHMLQDNTEYTFDVTINRSGIVILALADHWYN